MILAAFRMAIVDDFKANLSGLKECEPHRGRFDDEAIQTFATRTPGVRVALTGSDRLENAGTGELDLPMKAAAFVITTDQRDLDRDTAAMNLGEALAARVHGNTWGRGDCTYPTNLRLLNLYTSKAERRGIALWALTWEQSVRIGSDVYDTTQPFPTEIWAGWAPEIGAAHADDYETVAGGAS